MVNMSLLVLSLVSVGILLSIMFYIKIKREHDEEMNRFYDNYDNDSDYLE